MMHISMGNAVYLNFLFLDDLFCTASELSHQAPTINCHYVQAPLALITWF